jgi:hypothetical protein
MSAALCGGTERGASSGAGRFGGVLRLPPHRQKKEREPKRSPASSEQSEKKKRHPTTTAVSLPSRRAFLCNGLSAPENCSSRDIPVERTFLGGVRLLLSSQAAENLQNLTPPVLIVRLVVLNFANFLQPICVLENFCNQWLQC